MELVQSEPFCRLLAHMTGLDLAHSVIRPDLSTEQSDSEVEEGCSLREDNHTNQVVRKKQDDDPSSAEDDSGGNRKNHLVVSTDSKGPAAVCRCDLYSWYPGDYTLAGDESDPGYGVFCLDAMLNLSCEGTQCHGTVVMVESIELSISLILHAGWSVDQGGITSYIAKDEDEEVRYIHDRV